MSVETTSPAGEQLEGKELYARQKNLRATRAVLPAPSILAYGLEVPENIGAVLRLAEAVGSPYAVFVNDKAYELSRVRRTARSTEATVKWDVWSKTSLAEKIETLQPLIALELTTTSTSIFETELPAHFTFVVGSESYGLPPELLAHCQQAVHIPLYGVNGSMNVTQALAIALYEWRRRHE